MMRYICTGSFTSMFIVQGNRSTPAHFLASKRSYSCTFLLPSNGAASARFPAIEDDNVPVIARAIAPVITPVIAPVITPVIARERAYDQDRNAQSATDTPQEAPCVVYGTVQEQCALYRVQREGGG